MTCIRRGKIENWNWCNSCWYITFKTIVAGAVTYHNLTLDRTGLENLKINATDIQGAAQEHVSYVMKNIFKESHTKVHCKSSLLCDIMKIDQKNRRGTW